MPMNPIANHERPSSHMKWGLLAPATVLLGFGGLLFLGAAQEAAQNNAPTWGVASALAIAFALWSLLAMLYLINWRAARVSAAMARNAFIAPRTGGFIKGFLIGLCGVFVVHVALFFASFTPAVPEVVRSFASMAIALLPFSILYVIVALMAGFGLRIVRATRS